jgi:hypothetical protein
MVLVKSDKVEHCVGHPGTRIGKAGRESLPGLERRDEAGGIAQGIVDEEADEICQRRDQLEGLRRLLAAGRASCLDTVNVVFEYMERLDYPR